MTLFLVAVRLAAVKRQMVAVGADVRHAHAVTNKSKLSVVMRHHFFALTKNRLVQLMGQSIVLFLCLAYVEHVYVTNIFPDKQAQELFQPTQCVVMAKRLSAKGRLIYRYRADFLISYSANGEQYQRWVSGNGLDRGFFRDGTEQKSLLTQFKVGGMYPCWYSPTSPQQAMLLVRSNWLSTLPLLVPCAVAMVVLYYLLKTLFYLVDEQVMRSRKKRT
jgi:hypothetical protein